MKTEDWLTLSVIYRTKSLSSAAKELFISQPALTIRLQNIEKEVGCQIAIRSNKGLLFTPEGEYLSTQSQKITDLVNETLRHVQGTANEDIGIIKIVAPSTIAKYFLPALLLQSSTPLRSSGPLPPAKPIVVLSMATTVKTCRGFRFLPCVPMPSASSPSRLRS